MTVRGAGRRVFAIVASTTAVISLKLTAPVAPTPIAEALTLSATATAMPKASESIRRRRLHGDRRRRPSSVESSTTARVVVSIVLNVSERPSAAATAVFWLNAIASATRRPSR